MTYMNINVDIDIEDVWLELTDKEKHDFTNDSIKEGWGEVTPVALADAVELVGLALANDPAALLNVITWLRENGYTVEPA